MHSQEAVSELLRTRAWQAILLRAKLMAQATALAMFLAFVLVYLQKCLKRSYFGIGTFQRSDIKENHTHRQSGYPRETWHLPVLPEGNCLLESTISGYGHSFQPQSKSKDSGLPLGSDLNPFPFKTYIWHLKRRKQEKTDNDQSQWCTHHHILLVGSGKGFTGPLLGHP